MICPIFLILFSFLLRDLGLLVGFYTGSDTDTTYYLNVVSRLAFGMYDIEGIRSLCSALVVGLWILLRDFYYCCLDCHDVCRDVGEQKPCDVYR